MSPVLLNAECDTSSQAVVLAEVRATGIGTVARATRTAVAFRARRSTRRGEVVVIGLGSPRDQPSSDSYINMIMARAANGSACSSQRSIAEWLRLHLRFPSFVSRPGAGVNPMICGGLQILGHRMENPHGVDGSEEVLNFSAVETRFEREKLLRHTRPRFAGAAGRGACSATSRSTATRSATEERATRSAGSARAVRIARVGARVVRRRAGGPWTTSSTDGPSRDRGVGRPYRLLTSPARNG